ncbi:ATP-binding cassette domain-containing protein [Cutibacterium namnetense]|uniref:ABC transporter n=1 Tax=Cutibacterium namnetense TaxID=1574624 RepID=A0ABX9I972_9ACTN|nr:ATP-binding cassette domain-containing protein [Cutibacterium namnetense]REB69346.1 ABC transporter [Cutibacterium namnetense]TKW71743.1 MAG: ATP-binding cassette domain-containing protein [Cutibacterium acnes]
MTDVLTRTSQTDEVSGRRAVPVDVEGLTVGVPDRDEPILGPIDLHLAAGSRVLIAGLSGAGKTTLLHAIGGLLEEESYDLAGRVSTWSGGVNVGLLQQEPIHSVVAATCGRDIAFGPENHRVPREDIWPVVEDSQRRARFAMPTDHSTTKMSGGQMQRLAIAGILATNPGLLLLDEPISMLDEESAMAIRDEVAWMAHDRTVLVVDHHPDQWRGVLDQVVELTDHGTLKKVWDFEDFLDSREAVSLSPHTSIAGETVVRASAIDAHRPQSDDLLLRGVTMSARRGLITVVSGPSGAGKSTLLRLLAGLDAPASGELTLPGQVAWVPQNPENYLVAQTAADELFASPMVPEDADLRGLVRTFGLKAILDSHPMTCSGGEKRRLAIAAALAQHPDLLLLDEPTVGLDDDRGASVLSAIRAAADSGVAVVVSSHDRQVIEMADEIVDVAAYRVPDPTPDERREESAAFLTTINPLVVLLIAIAGIFGSLFVRSPLIGAIGLIPAAAMAPMCSRRVKPLVVRAVPVLVAAVMMVWTTLLLHSGFTDPAAWREAARQGLRILVFVLPGALASAAVDPTRLGDALVQQAHLPQRPVVASVAGVVRMGHLGDQWRIQSDVRNLRGLGPKRSLSSRIKYLSSMTFAMVLYAMRSSEILSRAMDSRGFATATRRTYAVESRWRVRDLWGVVLAVCVVAVPALAAALFG